MALAELKLPSLGTNFTWAMKKLGRKPCTALLLRATVTTYQGVYLEDGQPFNVWKWEFATPDWDCKEITEEEAVQLLIGVPCR